MDTMKLFLAFSFLFLFLDCTSENGTVSLNPISEAFGLQPSEPPNKPDGNWRLMVLSDPPGATISINGQLVRGPDGTLERVVLPELESAILSMAHRDTAGELLEPAASNSAQVVDPEKQLESAASNSAQVADPEKQKMMQ